MQAGKLNQRIDIVEAVRTQDTTGDVVIDWQVKESRRCRFAQQGGREFEAALQRSHDMTHLIVLRHVKISSADLVKMRIRHLDHDSNDVREFEIVNAQNMGERSRRTQISAREIIS